MTIHTLSGDQPHEDWGGWENFLASCEVRDQHDGVIFYGKTNCNFILFPDGILHQNYGYHGAGLMAEIREHGAAAVVEDIKRLRREIDDVMGRL